MKTSLIETKQLDEYLHGMADEQDIAVLETRLILEPQLQEKLKWQKLSYHLVQLYGRQKLKAEIERVHQKLFSQPLHSSFRKKIYSIFSR
jgi:hypothetical protein